MIRVEVNKDLRENKDTAIGPFSLRQIIFFLIGIALTYWVSTTFFPDVEIFSQEFTYISIFCTGIPIVVGCFPIHGLPIEQFVVSYLPYYLYPRVRIYDNGLSKPKIPKKTVKSRKKSLKRYK